MSPRSRNRGKSPRRATKKTPDAISLLKADHRQVEDWFEQFEKARLDSRKTELAAKICNALTVHTHIEEEIFYPALREALDEDPLAPRGLEMETRFLEKLARMLSSAAPRRGR